MRWVDKYTSSSITIIMFTILENKMRDEHAYVGNNEILKELKLCIVWLIFHLWSLKQIEIWLQTRYEAVSWKPTISCINY